MSQIPGNGDKSKLQDFSPPHPPPPPTSPESKALTSVRHQEKERDAHVMLSQEMVSQADRRGQGLIAELTDIISSLTLVLLPKLLLDSFNVLFKCAFRSFHFLLWVEEQVVQLHQLSRGQDGQLFSSLCSKKPGWADCVSRSGKRTWASELGSRAKASESTQILTKIINQSIID